MSTHKDIMTTIRSKIRTSDFKLYFSAIKVKISKIFE